MNTDLKPCPFCGSVPFSVLGGMYRCNGTESRQHAPLVFTAVEWNTRAPGRDTATLIDAVERLIYEATHLSPCKPDGSHDCTISAGTLAFARTVRSSARGAA